MQMEVYENDPCTPYIPKLKFADVNYDERNVRLISQMHKAISIIQFKLEGNIIKQQNADKCRRFLFLFISYFLAREVIIPSWMDLGTCAKWLGSIEYTPRPCVLERSAVA